MDQPRSSRQRRVAFFMSPQHPCGYLPGTQASTLFVDPDLPLNNAAYSQLLDRGFRRSGAFIYRPGCSDCQACVSVRVLARHFGMRRSDRRNWQRNQDLRVVPKAAQFDAEHFRLYRRYVRARHRDGSMDDDDPRRYIEFLASSFGRTVFHEFRLGERLVAVAVADRVTRGLSATYTFFDPDLPERGLGTFAILWQLDKVRALGLSHVYLGFWIGPCAKMSYKARFRPLEAYLDGRWRLFGPGEALPQG